MLNTTVPVRPVIQEGRAYCVDCFEEGRLTPNHPEHPRSPYCADHYRAARSRNQRTWRRNKASVADALERLSASGGSVVITDDAVALPRAAAADLLLALEEHRDDVRDAIEALNHLIDGGKIPAGAIPASQRRHWAAMLRSSDDLVDAWRHLSGDPDR